METIYTSKAPAAIGPYSQGKKVGNLLFFSGQLPLNPETGNMPETIKEQTEQVCENIKHLLASEGLDFSNVVKTTCLLSNITFFDAFNEVYAKYFTSKPARTCFAVAALPKYALVEIECVVEI